MPSGVGILALLATGPMTLCAAYGAQQVRAAVTDSAVASTLLRRPRLITEESKSPIIFKGVQADKYTFYKLEKFKR